MSSPEEHNQRRAHGLAVLVMDHLRERTAIGEAVTLWTLNAAICDRYALHGAKRQAQYATTRRVVASLEAAGLVESEKRWDKDHTRYQKHIWPCSVN